MFFTRYTGWELEGTSTTALTCGHCGNVSEHAVYVMPVGPQFGLIFLRRPLIGARKYYLACRVCGAFARELTKAQADAMRE